MPLVSRVFSTYRLGKKFIVNVGRKSAFSFAGSPSDSEESSFADYLMVGAERRCSANLCFKSSWSAYKLVIYPSICLYAFSVRLNSLFNSYSRNVQSFACERSLASKAVIF